MPFWLQEWKRQERGPTVEATVIMLSSESRVSKNHESGDPTARNQTTHPLQTFIKSA
jgi:hypothetical protein